MKTSTCVTVALLMSMASAFAEPIPDVELTASKDTFGRSNERNGNSGGSKFLLLASRPEIISLIGFDLTSVTNEIVSAELSFRVMDTVDTPLSLTIAPMVHHEKNSVWIEGAGDFGIRGQNAQIGEATFQWRAFRDRSWKDEAGKTAVNLMDSKLWKAPVADLKSVEWTKDTWVTVKMDDASMLEEIRNTEFKTATFGFWGTGGDGIYKINSKESGKPAKLVLTVKEAVKKQEGQP